MEESSAVDMEKALRVKVHVSAMLSGHPGVSLVDIGFDPTPSGEGENRLAVRVHVNHPLTHGQLALPEQVEGVPVRVVAGSYHLE
jgi:hypothetical protein